ncbi:MAG: hypothetical protein P8046_10915 [Anaerolineales bacterium]
MRWKKVYNDRIAKDRCYYSSPHGRQPFARQGAERTRSPAGVRLDGEPHPPLTIDRRGGDRHHDRSKRPANRLPPPYTRTIPIGLDAEYCWFEGLETVWKEAKAQHQREHVMPFFYEHPERFNILHITHEPNLGHLRWTVDTPEDLSLLRQIVAYFPGRDDFSWLEVAKLVRQHPELTEINAGVRHKDYREVDERK